MAKDPTVPPPPPPPIPPRRKRGRPPKNPPAATFAEVRQQVLHNTGPEYESTHPEYKGQKCSAMEWLFIEAYVNGEEGVRGVATQAALAAGVPEDKARSRGSMMLNRKRIRDAIEWMATPKDQREILAAAKRYDFHATLRGPRTIVDMIEKLVFAADLAISQGKASEAIKAVEVFCKIFGVEPEAARRLYYGAEVASRLFTPPDTGGDPNKKTGFAKERVPHGITSLNERLKGFKPKIVE